MAAFPFPLRTAMRVRERERERMTECVCVCVSDCVLRRLRHVWRIVELHNMHFFIAAIRCEIYNATHIDLLPDNCPESSAATMPRAEWICVLASARPLPTPTTPWLGLACTGACIRLSYDWHSRLNGYALLPLCPTRFLSLSSLLPLCPALHAFHQQISITNFGQASLSLSSSLSIRLVAI